MICPYCKEETEKKIEIYDKYKVSWPIKQCTGQRETRYEHHLVCSCCLSLFQIIDQTMREIVLNKGNNEI